MMETKSRIIVNVMFDQENTHNWIKYYMSIFF